MLVDICQSTNSDGTCASDVKDGVDYHNKTQIVQTYYDDFKCCPSGENFGTDYAILYEDPTADDDLNMDQ